MAGFTLIKIFCDTNVLHASQAHLLLSAKVSDYIAEHSRIESVELKWLLPRMVVAERRHQMLLAAQTLSPKIAELEKLLGHALGISDEVMAERIDSKISKTISELGIEICDVDSSAVDWDELIERSAQRRPPFEISGEKEKGFRDALIAAAFLQEHQRSPATPRSCLMVFVSGDERLRDYIRTKTEQAKNVRLLETLDDLKSLLNAIASEITEEYLAQLTPKAKETFYDFEKKEGLYVKEGVYETIKASYEVELNSVLVDFPGSQRKNSGVQIGDQTFISKKGQTIVWRRMVILKFKIVKGPDYRDIAAILAGKQSGLLGGIPSGETVLAEGRSTFSVEWQHQVTTTGKISKAKINRIDFVGHNFSENGEAE